MAAKAVGKQQGVLAMKVIQGDQRHHRPRWPGLRSNLVNKTLRGADVTKVFGLLALWNKETGVSQLFLHRL